MAKSNRDVIAELIATAQPRTVEVQVCARGDLVDRHAELVVELGQLGPAQALGADPEVTRLSEEIVAVEEAMESSTVTILLQSVSRRVWADLLASHPPRPQDKGMDHNPDTFPTSMLAVCCKSPGLSEEQAEQLSDVLPQGEWNKLYYAALGLNVTGTPHPKLSAASELVRANAASSTTQVTAASQEASS